MQPWDAYHRICLLIALIVASLFAQSQTPATAAVGKVPDTSSKQTNRPAQLTPKQQRGLRLLKPPRAKRRACSLTWARSSCGEFPLAMPGAIEAKLTGLCVERS
jgi:hypothetical protein